MAFDTVRTNKLRSGLTVLGVVIGITSIVAMTAAHPRIRPVARGEPSTPGWVRTRSSFSASASRASRAADEFSELMKRPSLTVSDAARSGAGDNAPDTSTSNSAAAPGRPATRRVCYRRSADTSPSSSSARPNFSPKARDPDVLPAGSSTARKSSTAATSSVLGNTAYQLLFAETGARSDRQDGSHRQRSVRGRGRVWQARRRPAISA